MTIINKITTEQALHYEVRGGSNFLNNFMTGFFEVYGLRDWWLEVLGKHYARRVKKKMQRYNCSIDVGVQLGRIKTATPSVFRN